MKNLYTFLAFLAVSIGIAQNPADRDPDFNPFNVPLNNYFVELDAVTKMALQADGKLLVIENSATLVRLNGNLMDTSFNTGTGFNGILSNVAVQSDGKIIAVGGFSTYNGTAASKIVRLNTDGSKDAGFAVGTGFDTANTEISQIALQADGKIVVAGNFTSYNGAACKNIIRINANGTRDASFNIGSGLDADGLIWSIKIQSDGKMILAGNFSTYNGAAAEDIVRVNANGTVDGTFVTGAGFDGIVNAMAVQTDGKVIVGGYFNNYNGTGSYGLARLNTNGTIDAAFVTGSGFGGGNVTDMILQADGKIVIGGNFSNYNGSNVHHLVRLNTDGTKDTAYLTGGAFDGPVTTMALKPDGKIIVAGNFVRYNTVAVSGMVQINTDGSKDASYNNQGAGFDDYVTIAEKQADGKTLVSGIFSSYNGITKTRIARLNADGTADNTFNIGTGFSYLAGMNYIQAIRALPNGKILVGGDFTLYNGVTVKRLIRLNNDGSLDTTFNNTNGAGATVRTIDVQADGKIIVGGDFLTYSSTTCSGVVRLNENGTLDTSFYISGTFNYPGSPPNVFNVAVLPDQTILVGGLFTSYNSLPANGIIRLLATGYRDTAFNLDASIPATGISEIKLLPDGKIMVAANSNIGLRRLNSNGSLDPGFAYAQPPSTFRTGYALQPDGKLIVVGYSTTTTAGYIKRLHANGTADDSFDASAGFNRPVNGVLVEPNGKIIAFGDFTKYKGTTERRIVRLKGTAFYTIQGTNRFDSNGNGCDASDIAFPNLNLQVSGPANSNFIANVTGNYHFGLPEGTYTLSPVFENPGYFTVSPSSVTVSFPSDASPFTQNFCIAANGTHNDLEVNVLPATDARPGADSNYKIIYKNKGNQVQSGSVVLDFNGNVLDFVSANPVVSSQTANTLSWNFSNLLPLETRIVNVTLNLNSPLETPPSNQGDVLSFSGTVTSSLTDEMPSDNTSILNQTVVNSLDPNDKNCVEGNVVGIEKIGAYVHYIIRFENSGTALAQNITVRDLIDTNKFDIASLAPVGGSHAFVTRIAEGNKAEFIFENINLPFDDANNDGFVAFKIKTKSTLVAGDSFTNAAGIYFDYNAAVNTNTATTLIQVLGTSDFAFSNYFSLYPNPADDVLNIHKKQDISIGTISIYNTLGQLVQVVAHANDVIGIDVSGLARGNYFMKIHSNLGISTAKFIKK